jgi:hypothetical protein
MAVAGPLFVVLARNPASEVRSGQLLGASPVLTGGGVRALAGEAIRALGMFVWQGDADWLYNVRGRPVFDPLAAGGFLVGFAALLRRWREPGTPLLLGWFALGLLPNLLVPPAASFSHAIAAQPAAYVLLGAGLEALRGLVAPRARPLALGTAALVLVWHAALSARAYFATWSRAPEVQELYQGSVTAVARFLDAQQPPGPVVVGAPYTSYWHPWNIVGFELSLRRDDLDVRWFNPAGAWVWPGGELPAGYYFPDDPLGPQSFDAQLRAHFAAAARALPVSDTRFAAFQVAHPLALASPAGPGAALLRWPPEWEDGPPPRLPLAFGGRLALTAIELADPVVPPGGELRLVTYWQVLAADPSPVVAFVHVTSDGDDIWGQVDWFDVWPAGLQPGDRFAQIHRVPVQAGTPAGSYHLQLGLYGPDTLRRLPIPVDGHTTADRVWVAIATVE